MGKEKAGRPIERPDTYRFSLYLDGDLEPLIKQRAWEKKQSITQYLNELVRNDVESNANCDANDDIISDLMDVINKYANR